jgi:3'-phosphoadenosine 5'-phosphosulfate sulfotransferase
MNVLFVTHYSSLYGANRSLLALIDGLDKEFIKPYVVLLLSGELEEALKRKNITIPSFKEVIKVRTVIFNNCQ